eukprot:scaffold692_cov118-Cylindrotheca_fusiformis.AAC.21
MMHESSTTTTTPRTPPSAQPSPAGPTLSTPRNRVRSSTCCMHDSSASVSSSPLRRTPNVARTTAPSPPLSSSRSRLYFSRNQNSTGSGRRLLLGIVALAATFLITSSPYERIALERIAYDWDISQVAAFTSSAASGKETERRIKQPSQKTPFLAPQHVQVHFLADATTPNPTSKFILDGLERSSYMELTGITIAQLHATERQLATLQVYERDERKSLVYIVDWGSMNRDCHLLQTLLGKLQVPKTSSIVLMDFTASHRHEPCLGGDTGNDGDGYQRVFYTKRSLVQNRYFDSDWTHPGDLMNERDSVIHSPLILRESFVDMIQNVSSTLTTKEKKQGRTTNVLFNWKPGDYSHYAFLRRRVAEQVTAIHGNVTSLADETYVRALLQSKIVVVTQRDEWEDHYRLYESLASGALVLTDPMLVMPHGLANGTNLLVYRNVKELKSLARYYLKHETEREAIAKRGFAMVMGRHRSWHRMEEILFGSPQTLVDQPYSEAPRKMERPEMKVIEHIEGGLQRKEVLL